MKCTFIKEVIEPVNAYGYIVKTGDVADLTDHQANKAITTGDWVQADNKAKVTAINNSPSSEEAAQVSDAVIKRLADENAKLKAENDRLSKQNKKLKAAN